MNKNNEVVVVEGYHDLAQLKAIYPDIEVIITNGSEISDDTLNELKSLNKSRGLILFLDPDYQGERIRRLINDFVGETKHAFLPKERCISSNRKKVGIEHASKKDIIGALSNVLTSQKTDTNTIQLKDLYQLKLIGAKESRIKREFLSKKIGIGLSNGKTFHKKLNMFGITLQELKDFLKG